MKRYYSPSTSGFYLEGIHNDLPEDAIEVAEDQYQTLLEGQSLGKNIVYKGRKLQLEEYTPEPVSWDKIREVRSDLLAKSDWTQMPDNPLSEEARNEWKTYRQALRDITETYKTPEAVAWPLSPANKEG